MDIINIFNEAKTEEIKGNDFQNIIEEFTINAKLLNLDDVILGETFSGVVFATKIVSNKNRNESNKYDITMQLIDKNGKSFIATYFGHDEKIAEINTPVLIDKGIYKQAINSRQYYNILKFTLYRETNFPKRLFLNQVEKYNVIKEEFNNLLKTISVDKYKSFIKSLKDLGYLEEYYNDRYKSKYGLKIGSMMDYFIKSMEIVKVVDLVNNDKKFEEDLKVDLITVILIWHYKDILNTIPEYCFRTELYINTDNKLKELYEIYSQARGIIEAVNIKDNKLIINILSLLEKAEEKINNETYNYL